MRRVVVGVRGDSDVDPAVDFAVEEAVRRRIPLELIHAFQLPNYGELPNLLAPRQAAARREAAQELLEAALDRAVDRVPGGGTVAAELTVLEGLTVDALLSREPSAAMFVVGTRGGGPLRRAARGSVSASLLHRSWAPVVVVPQAAPRVPDRYLTSRVVVALDGGPASLAALQWSVAQAQEWGCELTPVVVSALNGRPPAAFRDQSNNLGAAVWRCVRQAGGQSVEVHPHFLEGAPASTLLDFVHPQDLLVTGSRGRGGPASLVLGSTSTTVAEHATCPVVVIREGQARRETHQRALRAHSS